MGTKVVGALAGSDCIPEAVLFGQSSAMAAVRRTIKKAAGTGISVLIGGESGTGKDVVARFIHDVSPWGKGPFIKISCPAIPAALIEAELFGYEKGAFTGALGAKPGRMESAASGTLFLDEIAELEPGLQAKLLHVLQDGQFCRIGAAADRKLEARLLCGTSRVLEEEIIRGRFRPDLFYRINVVNLHLPALRERVEDIPTLVDYFINRNNEKYGCRAQPLSPALLLDMQCYEWPGNIRELENLIRRYVILNDEKTIRIEISTQTEGSAVPELPAGGKISLKKLTQAVVRELERKVILKVLEANNWNRKQAAQALSISYRSLQYKIQAAGISQDPK